MTQNSFVIFAGECFFALCAILLLLSVLFEIIKSRSVRAEDFYKIIFWAVYLAMALLCGFFVLAFEPDSSEKSVILIILIVINIGIAGKISQILKKTARKTVAILKIWYRKAT